jgi:hypothetical protein
MNDWRDISLFALAGLLLGTGSSFAYARYSAQPVSAPVAAATPSATPSKTVVTNVAAPQRASAPNGVARTPAPPPLDEATKRAIVQTYYDSINSGDWNSAYNMLSDDFHRYQSFDNFKASYASTIHMTIHGMRDYSGTPIMGLALIDEERSDNGVVFNGYVGYVEFAFNISRGQWLIDERKLDKVASENVEPPTSPPEVALTAAPDTDNCTNEVIDAVSEDGQTIRLVDGGVYDLDQYVDWDQNMTILLCNRDGHITMSLDNTVVNATPRE